MASTSDIDPLASPAPVPAAARGIRRLFLLAFGLLNLVFAGIGAVVPGIPATPFVLVASYCFVRTSPRLHRWLLASPYFGRLIRDWQQHGGIRRSTRLTACGVIFVVVGASVASGRLQPPWLAWLVVALAGVGITVVLALPGVRGPVTPASTNHPPES